MNPSIDNSDQIGYQVAMRKSDVYKSMVFQETREAYIHQINAVELDCVAPSLGFVKGPGGYSVPLFNRLYTVTQKDIVDADGRPAAFDACVVLSRYLIMGDGPPDMRLDWTAFRDFSDAGPLLKYFIDNVAGAITKGFRGRTAALVAAADRMGGRPGADDLSYDVTCRFEALPQIGMLMLFNDGDDEFGADCRVLFERRTERYLDMECVAMLGARLAAGLCRQA